MMSGLTDLAVVAGLAFLASWFAAAHLFRIHGKLASMPENVMQESDVTNISTNLDTEYKTASELIGLLPIDEKQHDLTPLRETIAELKANTDLLLKFAAAAGAQAPGPVTLSGLTVPTRRNAMAGATLPAVPPTVDPVVVPTTPPIGPTLQKAERSPEHPQDPEPGAPGLAAT